MYSRSGLSHVKVNGYNMLVTIAIYHTMALPMIGLGDRILKRDFRPL